LDKKLKYHSLIQAMSRTNRILNSVKSNGNIVFFRNLENAVNEALRLFSSESNINSSIAILRSFKEYYEGYYNEDNQYIQGYRNLVEELKSNFKIPFNGTKEEERIFIKLFGDILKYKNLLSQFSEFEQNDDLIGTEMQDYQSIYIGLRDKYQDKKRMETDSIVSDLDFKIELISQQDIGVDYILKLMNEKLKKDLKEVMDLSDPKNPKSLMTLGSRKYVAENGKSYTVSPVYARNENTKDKNRTIIRISNQFSV